MRSRRKICRNWWDGFWTQTITKIPPISDYYFLAHSQCSLKFACKFIPWYLHYVDELTSKMYGKTINLLCAGNKLFVKYQAQGGGVTPSPLAHGFAEYQLSALQASVSEVNTINTTTQQFITAKISGCALKQASKTHSSLRPSNLPLYNDAALMSFRIRVMEHRSGWLDRLAYTPVCKIESCKTTQELRMRMKYARKLSIFYYV